MMGYVDRLHLMNLEVSRIRIKTAHITYGNENLVTTGRDRCIHMYLIKQNELDILSQSPIHLCRQSLKNILTNWITF